MMWDHVPYSQARLDKERGTPCPACGPTTWIASVGGFACCGCGEDLEGLLPELCFACGGSGWQGAGGGVIGAWQCSTCRGTGKRRRFAPPELDPETKAAVQEEMEKFKKRLEGAE